MLKLEISAKTDVGIVRDHNEDDFIMIPDMNNPGYFPKGEVYTPGDKGVVLIVADGMGGMNAGEIAAKIAVNTAKKYFMNTPKLPAPDIASFMKNIFIQANAEMVAHSKANPDASGMGTTMVIAWLLDGIAHVAWVGDSRAYLLRPGDKLRQITNDHSLVQEWIDEGRMTDEQAFYHPQNNVVTRSLGDTPKVPKADYRAERLKSGDRLLLCSDGLNGMLLDPQIHDIMDDAPLDIGKTGESLVSAALEAGGKDNITLILSRIHEVGGVPMELESVRDTAGGAVAKINAMGLVVPVKTRKDDNLVPKKYVYILGTVMAVLALAMIYTIWGLKSNKDTTKIEVENNSFKVDSLRKDSLRKIENGIGGDNFKEKKDNEIDKNDEVKEKVSKVLTAIEKEKEKEKKREEDERLAAEEAKAARQKHENLKGGYDVPGNPVDDILQKLIEEDEKSKSKLNKSSNNNLGDKINQQASIVKEGGSATESQSKGEIHTQDDYIIKFNKEKIGGKTMYGLTIQRMDINGFYQIIEKEYEVEPILGKNKIILQKEAKNKATEVKTRKELIEEYEEFLKKTYKQ